MTESVQRLAGKRVVVVVYLAIVALTGALGAVVGLISGGNVDPRLFGLIDLPPTPLGMAIYGVVTVGLLLGLLLALVEYVSKKTGASAE